MNKKYTKEILEEIVKNNKSYAGVLKDLGLKQAGGTQSNIINRIKEFNISTEHFTGMLWNKGECFLTDDRIKSSIPKEEIFCLNSTMVSGKIRDIIISSKIIEYKCKCGITNTWLDKNITLELHHINGNHSDNRIENLCFLCPNCHSQTSSFRNKGRRSKLYTEEEIISLIKESKSIYEVIKKGLSKFEVKLSNKTIKNIMRRNNVLIPESVGINAMGLALNTIW